MRFLKVILFSLIVVCCKFQSLQAQIPVLSPPQRDTARKNIVITLNRDQSIIIDDKKHKLSEIDSLLQIKINSSEFKNYIPKVVIVADSLAYYKDLFYIMQAAKRHQAVVIATIKSNGD